MKELSIEEKAERYDASIERASNLHKDAVEMENSIITKTCEVIFPELVESEDERIRNSIIHLVEKSQENGGYALHKDEAEKMLAWLEKQSVQKHTDKVEPKQEWSEEDENIINKIP